MIIVTNKENINNLISVTSCASNISLKECLKVLMLLSFFRTSGALFHIEEPMTERAICPVLIFRKEQIGFR